VRKKPNWAEALNLPILAHDGDAKSNAELQALTGWSRPWLRDKLIRLHAQGRIVVERRRGRNICGHITWTPVYRLVTPGAEDKT